MGVADGEPDRVVDAGGNPRASRMVLGPMVSSPTAPNSFLPQQETRPDRRRAQAVHVTGFDSDCVGDANDRGGRGRSSRVPSPSWPVELLPQHSTAPAAVTAHMNPSRLERSGFLLPARAFVGDRKAPQLADARHGNRRGLCDSRPVAELSGLVRAEAAERAAAPTHTCWPAGEDALGERQVRHPVRDPAVRRRRSTSWPLSFAPQHTTAPDVRSAAGVLPAAASSVTAVSPSTSIGSLTTSASAVRLRRARFAPART